MTILFICGSLAPGRDGVGDYTRRLAGEIIRQGHSASIIALNDRHIDTIERGSQTSDGTEVSVLRLPDCLAKTERWRQVAAYIEEQNPEWLSLQFVPYAFQRKGLPFGLGRQLAQIGKGRKWHVMFHELWVGVKKDSPLRHLLIKPIQQYCILQLLAALSPLSITTSNKMYQLLLNDIKCKADILPLFSNISFDEATSQKVDKIFNNTIDISKLEKYHIIGLFGSLYHHESVASVIEKRIQANKDVIVICFGRNGNTEGMEYLRKRFNKIIFIEYGECSSSEVSIIMQTINEAISSTPKQFLGKSGVFAAFRYHNVSVISEVDTPLRKYNDEVLIYNENLFQRPPEEWGVQSVSSKLIDFLKMRSK